jgi:hypothetical protein
MAIAPTNSTSGIAPYAQLAYVLGKQAVMNMKLQEAEPLHPLTDPLFHKDPVSTCGMW